MGPDPGRRGAFHQQLDTPDRVLQARVHRLAAHPLPARRVMHLTEIGAVPEPPRLRQLRRGLRPSRSPAAQAAGAEGRVLVVEEPGDVPPPAEPLRKLDRIRRGAPGHPHQLRRARPMADGLGVEEYGDDRLLRLAAPAQRRQLVLDLPRLAELRFQQGRPRGLVPFGLLGGRHARQLAHRVRDLLPAG